MKHSILPLILTFIVNGITLYDFNKKSDISNWKVIDDVVMGGRSAGEFYLNNDGHGVFEGSISLENNGGFSSVRYLGDKIALLDQNKIIIRLKGDGKKYQFRIKANSSDYYSYVYDFETSGTWETITIPLNSFQPSFRGSKLKIPNFSSKRIDEIGFLIGNKENEKFKLIIDHIKLL